MNPVLIICLVAVLTPVVVFFSIKFGVFAWRRGLKISKDFEERENNNGE